MASEKLEPSSRSWRVGAPGDTARFYHRLTATEPGREDSTDPFLVGWQTSVEPPVIADFVPNDLATFPAPCKAYPDGLPVVELPRSWPEVAAPATAVLAGRHEAARAPLDVATLARLLYLSAGVVRVVEREGRPTLMLRAAGSAGGRSPYELYVAARDVEGLADGVHWYDPVEHALVQVAAAPAGDVTSLVVTGVPWRTGWRYAERGGLRHVYWDAGTMLAQTLVLAESAGLGPRLRTRFPDTEVARLVGADGVHEFPVALVTFGDGAPAIGAQGDAASGAVDAAPREFPLVTLAQHAGDDDQLGEPWPAPAPLAGDPPPSEDLDAVILRRGSTRIMDPAGTVPRDLLEFALAASLRGIDLPHFAAVHAVEGMEPGLYRWPDLDHPRRAEPLRDELFRAALDQDLGRDSAFVVIAAADLDALDDRGYREAQLAAGIVAGRLHLAAYALGIGASGMTFMDAYIPELLGEPLAGLLFVCVGVPAYRNKAGGRPGQPASIVYPTRR